MGHNRVKQRKIILIMTAFAAVLLLTGCAAKKISVTDVAQNNFSEVGATEDGYYFMQPYVTGGQLIYYYPVGAEQSVVLCNKPNCTHSCDVSGCQHKTDSADCGFKNCDGYIRDENCPSSLNGIKCYAGKLYFMMTDDKGLGLYTIAADGSVRERVCIIDENRQQNVSDFVICKGYLYYVIDNYENSESVQSVYKINLNKPSEKELVFEKRGEYLVGRYFKGCDEGVFFSEVTQSTAEDNSVHEAYELFQINDDGACDILGRDDVSGYTVTDGCVYYHSLNDAMLYRYDLNTKETAALYKTQDNMMYYIWYDSNYIYLDNMQGAHYYWFEHIDVERIITVLDKNGTFVADIKLDDPDDVNTILYTRGCDENYFIFTNLNKSWYVYDKKNIGSQKCELIRIWGE